MSSNPYYIDPEDDDWSDKRRAQLRDWLGEKPDMPPYRVREISSALYAFSEMSLFPDIESIDVDEAIRVWQIIERVRRDGFPDGLGM